MLTLPSLQVGWSLLGITPSGRCWGSIQQYRGAAVAVFDDAVGVSEKGAPFDPHDLGDLPLFVLPHGARPIWGRWRLDPPRHASP